MSKNTFDDHMSAAAFAEACEFDTARQILGDNTAKGTQVSEARKPYVKTAVFGAISIVAYFLIFTHQDAVTGLFTMGGWNAVFPVGTALVFSFIHGAFTSNLLSAMNIEAKK